ncbi:hypothetical protein [Teredinibacter purpureus]|uniref:hypothetical protein n=1 Tax=Teredinibacter purpureus TaxID=2731756 RepID=UPI0005F8282E|nr:hypothetical protein [Teredinibacter purpureus]
MPNTTNDILSEICEGRADLLALGYRFNEEAECAGRDLKDMSDLNETVAAIFELEDMPLTDRETQLIHAMDKLNWSDDQAIEFLKAMGGI